MAIPPQFLKKKGEADTPAKPNPFIAKAAAQRLEGKMPMSKKGKKKGSIPPQFLKGK